MRGALPPCPDIAVVLQSDGLDSESVIPALADCCSPEPEICTFSDSDDEIKPTRQESISKQKSGNEHSTEVILTPLPVAEASDSAGSAFRPDTAVSTELSDLGEPEEFLFLVNKATGIAHIAKQCAEDHPALQVMLFAESGNRALRTGCSVRSCCGGLCVMS